MHINSHVELNFIKFQFLNVCFIRVIVYDEIVTVLTFTQRKKLIYINALMGCI